MMPVTTPILCPLDLNVVDTETINLGLGKIRPHFQGETAYTQTGRCPQALPY